MIYEWKLHQCQAGHFHFLSLPDFPSWPFWSYWAGRLMLKLVSKNNGSWPSEDQILWKKEIAMMHRELKKLVGQRRRNKLGQFEEGRGDERFILPKKRQQHDQGEMAQQWRDFFAGKFGNVFIYVDVMCQHFPLTCDFIYRRGEKTRERRKEAWLLKDMMKAPTKPVTPKEKGIILKKLVA